MAFSKKHMTTLIIVIRIRLTCTTLHLESCGEMDREAPMWKDYLIISPSWDFRKSWVYCGQAVTVNSLTHTSLCDKMAITFRSNGNAAGLQGFECSYQVIE